MASYSHDARDSRDYGSSQRGASYGGGAPPAAGGYSAPPAAGGYSAPPAAGYGAPPAAGGYRGGGGGGYGGGGGGYGGGGGGGYSGGGGGGYRGGGGGGGGGGGVCFDFQKGHCSRGEGCRFRHTMEGARGGGGGGGYGGGGGGGDRMGALGAGLNQNIAWDLTKLAQFEKNFYMEHPAVTACTEAEVQEIRKKADMTIIGNDVPKPVRTFDEASFPSYVLGEIKKLGFDAPTAIQMQGWPMALSGRDMIGIAATGSGKTLAFILPGIVHINAQVCIFYFLFLFLFLLLFFFFSPCLLFAPCRVVPGIFFSLFLCATPSLVHFVHSSTPCLVRSRSV